MFAPALPGFPTRKLCDDHMCGFLFKESRMRWLNVTNLDRKSGIRGPN